MVVSMEPLTPEAKSVLTAWGETVNVDVKEMSDRKSRILAYITRHPSNSRVLLFCAVEEFGRANLREVITPTASTVATICYTSVRITTRFSPSYVVLINGVQGTTGLPKGEYCD